MNEMEKDRWLYLKILGVIILGAIVFWFLAIVSYSYFGFALGANNVVLTLVGILATFVMVSNYMQMAEVKRNIDKRIDDAIQEYDYNVNAAIYQQAAISITWGE
jgi:hypothetical protein